jgi:hypothetical protein
MKPEKGRREDLFSFDSSHFWPFAVRTPSVERQEETATGNQDPFGIRAIPKLPGLPWWVAYK